MRPTRLEVASGAIVGPVDDPAPLPAAPVGARTALELAVLPALRHSPCLVAFSGGRDSSAMLALTVHVARTYGLEPPVALTVRHRGFPETHETSWQELLVRHLRPLEWITITHRGELGLLGTVAREGLLRHGVNWPPNAHFVRFVALQAPGGALVTGFDGDGLLDSRRWWRLLEALAGFRAPTPRDLPRLALALSPRSVKARRQRRHSDPGLTWLRPEVRQAVERSIDDHDASEPLTHAAFVRWYSASRYIGLAETALRAQLAGTGTRLVNPLLDRSFLSAYARAGGRFGFPDRASALTALVGDLLPTEVVRREDKAWFTRALISGEARDYAGRTREFPLPLDLVRPAAVRATWSHEQPHFCSWMLLQAAWLASELGVGFDDALSHGHPDGSETTPRGEG